MIIGDVQSGKSSFVNKIVNDKFTNNYSPTLGVDYVDKHMEVSGTLFYFNILDFSGR
jgi:GTPase SAR1 family protein